MDSHVQRPAYRVYQKPPGRQSRLLYGGLLKRFHECQQTYQPFFCLQISLRFSGPRQGVSGAFAMQEHRSSDSSENVPDGLSREPCIPLPQQALLPLHLSGLYCSQETDLNLNSVQSSVQSSVQCLSEVSEVLLSVSIAFWTGVTWAIRRSRRFKRAPGQPCTRPSYCMLPGRTVGGILGVYHMKIQQIPSRKRFGNSV